MHHFHYKNESLHCENVDLSSITDTYGTPTYIYSAQTFRDSYQRLDKALAEIDHEISYAVKANSNIAILHLLKELGSGFDIVSAGELYRVIAAGGDAAHCTFAGVGKTDEEINYALDQGIYCFNVESIHELEVINSLAKAKGIKAPVALRVNPNVDAKTHKYISTGKAENKFGIDFEAIEGAYAHVAANLDSLEIKGLQMHIGSQLTQVKPFEEAVNKVLSLVRMLKDTYAIEFFSIGGGIGIVYEDALASGQQSWWDKQTDEQRPLTPELYAERIVPLLKPLGLKILLEPGRFIAGNAGVLVTECLYEKSGKSKSFRMVDAAMNDLIRPALYEGYHQIVPFKQSQISDKTLIGDIVGPICETGDFFCQSVELPNIERGDYIALMSAGAYGFTMASNYNSRPLPTEILVDGDEFKVIRKRQTFTDLIAGESV